PRPSFSMVEGWPGGFAPKPKLGILNFGRRKPDSSLSASRGSAESRGGVYAETSRFSVLNGFRLGNSQPSATAVDAANKHAHIRAPRMMVDDFMRHSSMIGTAGV